MSSGRRHVMCDDILGLIFKRLDIKDVFALQRVSEQFSRCSQQVLKSKRGVSIGFNGAEKWTKQWSKTRCRFRFSANHWNRIDITPAIASPRVVLTLDYNRRQNRLESIVRQFCGVEKLYLSTTVISFAMIELFVKQWPQLEELYINDIEIDGLSDGPIGTQATDWAKVLSNVKHISVRKIDPKIVPFLTRVIQEMESFRSLDVWGLWSSESEKTITLSLLKDCLPANMRSLHVGVTPADSQALDDITEKCRQLRELSIKETKLFREEEDMNIWNQWFAMVCNRNKNLRYFKVIFIDISAKEFARSIAKLTQLRRLVVSGSGHFSHRNTQRMCFDTQEMARYMRPMVSLRSLSLIGLKCSPNRWSNLAQMLPNVREMSLRSMDYYTDCEHGSNCYDCFHGCMELVSKLPKLKRLLIVFGGIQRQTLDLFASMDELSIAVGYYANVTEVLIGFVTQTLANRRGFRLQLFPEVKRQLTQRMAEMNVSIPESLIVSHIYKTQDKDE